MDLINITSCDGAMESTDMVAVGSIATAIRSVPGWSATGPSKLSFAATVAEFTTASSAFA
jgi:hypothetical protein